MKTKREGSENRSNSGYTYDALNRMTASPGHCYEHDILGNRTWRNPFSSTTVEHVWDDAGRMTKAAGPSNGATYSYRADGMRTKKVTGLTLAYIEDPESETSSGFYDEYQAVNHPTWRYRYDGQMCFEEDFTTVDGTTLTQTGTTYALGARGIDMLQPYSVNTSNWTRTYGEPQFPLYDGHGNMMATLVRDGQSYGVGNSRQYDAWGGVRTGASTGDPNTRYCANLGHQQDDELASSSTAGDGLIYMRARYYEPGTGRFVSEDPARAGWNWYVYCYGDPVNFADKSGCVPGWIVTFLTALALGVGVALGQWTGYVAGVLYWQLDDPTFQGQDSSTIIGSILQGLGLTAGTGLAVARYGPATYRMTVGLAARLGIVGALGYLVGLWYGFLQATLDFLDYETSQLP